MFKRVTSLMIVLVFVLTMIGTSALAGNTCSQINGSSAGTTTFTINTGKRWLASDKITFTQTKGTCAYNSWLGGRKTMNIYGKYYIYYTKSGGQQKLKYWTGQSTTLSLDKNSTYTVKIVPYSMSAMNDGYYQKGSLVGWTKNSTWKVTNTKGINFCT